MAIRSGESCSKTTAELSLVTAGGALRIGSGTLTGNITVSAAITLHAGYNTLELKTGGNISGGGSLARFVQADLRKSQSNFEG